jgi:dTMP kinase
MKRGKLIVFEGIDGAGCETQARMLRDFFVSSGMNPLLLKYPDNTTPLGRTIKEFLYGKFVLTPDVQFLLYSLDIKKDIWVIESAMKKGRDVICDRYFTSTLAYQCLDKKDIERALKFSELFGILKPDIVFYLDINPKIALERKKLEKKDLDIYERNIKFIKEVRNRYKKLIKKKIFAKNWFVIDASKSKSKVHEKIKEILLNEIGVKK